MQYIEMTVNKSHDFKNSDEIYKVLKVLDYKVVLISNELTQTTNETHFHVLIELNEQQEQNIQETLNNLYDSINIIPRHVKNINATILYFIKDGQYKLYNGFIIPPKLTKNKIDIKLLVDDIKKGFTYHDLVLKYGMVIIKNAYGINHLIGSINQK